jgi:hypothetical protein
MPDGDVLGFLPGIDLRAAYDTHTFGSMWVVVQAAEKPDRRFALAGDNVYVYENLDGWARDGVMRPVGHVVGSHLNTLMAVDEMVRACNGNTRHVIPVHEERLTDEFPSSRSPEGLMIVEVALEPGVPSRLVQAA